MKNLKSYGCQIVMAILIIVLVWWWTPTWANWGITVLAGLIALRGLVGSFQNNSCCVDKKPASPGQSEEEDKPAEPQAPAAQ